MQKMQLIAVVVVCCWLRYDCGRELPAATHGACRAEKLHLIYLQKQKYYIMKELTTEYSIAWENFIYLNLFYPFFNVYFFVFSFLSVDTPHVVIKICKAAPPLFLLLIHTPHMATVFSHHNCRSSLLLQVLSEFLACLKWTQCRMQFLFLLFCDLLGYITASLSLSYVVQMNVCRYV